MEAKELTTGRYVVVTDCRNNNNARHDGTYNDNASYDGADNNNSIHYRSHNDDASHHA